MDIGGWAKDRMQTISGSHWMLHIIFSKIHADRARHSGNMKSEQQLQKPKDTYRNNTRKKSRLNHKIEGKKHEFSYNFIFYLG
jgi:hypothetical protein